jgi:Ca2+-transporting ATPase
MMERASALLFSLLYLLQVLPAPITFPKVIVVSSCKLVIHIDFIAATTDYKQSLQFQNLNEEKQNINLEVVRAGRRIKVSIYDLVVGDVVPLKIGDQVPADGILISGHSFSIDESSMTGESKIVNKDQKSPFMMSGCKVADGYGTMLVTAVGINTEWGLLMASISEDSGEETPLQV